MKRGRFNKVHNGELKKIDHGNDNHHNHVNEYDLSDLLLVPIFLIILSALTISNAHAAENSSGDKNSTTTSSSTSLTETKATVSDVTKTSDLVPTADEDSFGFSGSVALEYSSSLQKRNDPLKDDATSLIFAPVYKFNAKQSIDSRIDFIQEHHGEEKSHLTNLILVGTPTTYEIKKDVLTFKPKVGVTLPTDEQSNNDDTFRGSISLRPTFTWSVSQIKGLTLANVTYLAQNFHEFEVKRNGSANTEYSLRNRIAISYSITDRLALELINDYARGWSYNGYAKENFYFSQELAYEVVKSWHASISHSNKGSARGPNNSGSNVEVFDERSSTVAVGVTKEF